ncbi:hypothetical protein PZA11_004668 [Diplocarpon coronariae]|nr:carnitinyl-CoA dehydratase [Diplocarpon mali]
MPPHFRITTPSPQTLLVTLTRPGKLNCIDTSTSRAIAAAWQRLDDDPSLCVGVITGEGRAFCAGADLLEWNTMNLTGTINPMTAPGLAGLPRRAGKKPIIAAVNGLCMGGGLEMIANCDMVLASPSALFALPEARRGIVPVAGCLPRLVRTLGLQRTSQLVLTGRSVDAHTLERWGLVNRVVAPGQDVVREALGVAAMMCENSPDALIVGRRGVRLAWEAGGVEEQVAGLLAEGEQRGYEVLVQGANFREGIRAFNEKRAPRWVDSKL